MTNNSQSTLLLYCCEDVKSHRSGGDTVPLRNAADFMQVVGSTVFIQVSPRVASSLLASSNYIKSVKIRIDAN